MVVEVEVVGAEAVDVVTQEVVIVNKGVVVFVSALIVMVRIIQ